MPSMYADPVRAHARAFVLLALKRAINGDAPEPKQLAELNAACIEEACLAPKLRLWAGDFAVTGTVPDAATALGFIRTSQCPSETPFVPARSLPLSRIVGDPYSKDLVQEPEVVRHAWTSAQEVLGILGLNHLLSLTRAVHILAGLRGPWGEIRSLSNPLVPGFIAIGVSNPPVTLAEQVVHEAMQVVFSARLFVDPSYSDLLDKTVGILSPLTDSIQTVAPMTHGMLSYAVVENLWAAILASGHPEKFTATHSHLEAQQIAASRVGTIRARLQLAARCLADGAGLETLLKVGDTLRELASIEPPWNIHGLGDRKASVTAAGYSDDIANLDAIRRAELTLATTGFKVSRISVPFKEVAKIGFALVSHAAVVGSSWATRAVSDSRLGGFSNVSDTPCDILEAPADSQVHLYVHASSSFARVAAALDREGKAGELFGIPTCCQKWFADNWQRVSSVGGDLFADLIQRFQAAGRCEVAKECDVSAMYRGGGFCWHFPCHPRCEKTVKLVQARRAAIMELDASLVSELESAYRPCIVLLPDGTYSESQSAAMPGLVVNFVSA